jgi:opacity protein-like surface antigen
VKQFISTTAFAAVLAGSAIAGAVEYVAPVEPEMAAPVSAAKDWSGFYAGGFGAMATGTQNDHMYGNYVGIDLGPVDWSADTDIDGTLYGAFAGYNFTSGSMVFGLEAAYSMGSVGFEFGSRDDMSDDQFDFFGWLGEFYGGGAAAEAYSGRFSSFVDLKARAGFSAGSALVYGFAGLSLGEYQYFEGGVEIDEFPAFGTSGMNYGVGIDYLVTDSIFLGVEYIIRDQAGTVYSIYDVDEGSMDWDMTANVQAIQIRAGMKF